MKRPIVLVLSIFILFSCKKEQELKNLKEDIQGIWEIEISASAFWTINYSPGNGQTIVFSGSGAFERRNYDTVIFKGAYSLKYQEDCKPGLNIVLTTDEYPTTDFRNYISIKSGKLFISSTNCTQDGGYSYYRRIQ